MTLVLALLLLQQPSAEAMDWFQKAEALIGTPREYSDEQAALLAKAVAAAPNFAEARFNLALIHLRNDRFEDALAQLSEYVKLSPDQIAGQLLKARCEIALNRRQEAAESLRRGLEIEPDNAEALRVSARNDFELGRFEDARSLYERLLQLPSPTPAVWYEAALTEDRLGNAAAAAAHLGTFVEHQPEDLEARKYLASLLLGLGRPEEALEQLRAARRLAPSDAELASRVGNLLLDLGKDSEAAQAFEGAEESIPNLVNRAVALERQGEAAQAEKLLRQALKEDMSTAQIWGHLGDAMSAQDHDLEALAAYSQAIERDPHDVDSLTRAAAICVDTDKNQRGRDYFQAALKIKPDDASVHLGLGLALERVGAPADEALQHYEEALRLGTERPLAHFRLGFLYARKGMTEEALAHLETALKADAERYHPLIAGELRRVHSDLDSIRYTAAFAELMKRYP